MRAFIRLGRPKFLLGGFLMFALGTASSATVNWQRYFWAQLMIAAIQLTAQYANEYADFEHDIAVTNRTAFSGGSGVLVSGALPRNVALRAAQCFYALGIICIIVVGAFSTSAGVVGAFALLIAWTYSMPPLRLISTGFGELATAICVGALVPLAGILSQQSFVPNNLWMAMIALVGLQMVMLLAFELPDLESDKYTGKRVLGVRLGFDATYRLMGVIAISAGLVAVATTPWCVIALPTAIALFLTLRRHAYNAATFCAVATFFLSGVGFLISLI